MSNGLKATEILKEHRLNLIKTCERVGVTYDSGKIDEAIKELEEYEQNFKQKEFDYRTQCQNVLSAARLEADEQADRLAELEKVILDYYLAKDYVVGVGNWAFHVSTATRFKHKNLQVYFHDGSLWNRVCFIIENTTKEMWDKSIEHFTTLQNEVMK